MPSHRFFYGLEPRWFTWDRFYRVSVSERMIAGAWVAGDFYDEKAARLKLREFGPLLRGYIARQLKRRTERESFYDTADPFAPGFLDHDSRNFQISRGEVVGCRLQRRHSYGAGFNVGSIEITMLDGSVRRLVLAGEQDPNEVLETMRTFDATIEAVGKAPLERKPLTSRQKAQGKLVLILYFLVASVILLGAAISGRFHPAQTCFFAVLGLVSVANVGRLFFSLRKELAAQTDGTKAQPSDNDKEIDDLE